MGIDRTGGIFVDVATSPASAGRPMAWVGTLAIAALAIAFASQHLFGMQPCPWCIVQRLIVIGIALLAFTSAGLLGAVSRGTRALGGAAAAGVLALAILGAVAAWHQHTVASRQFSCSFTWADRFLMSAGLDRWWPGMFEVRATCADAAQALLLWLPFEMWSGALFVVVSAMVGWQVVSLLRRPRARSFRA
jgi:protein dithiol:quinone oxidoreductase